MMHKLPHTCAKCGAAVEYETYAGVLVAWHESEDGHKLYDCRCPNCGCFEYKGPRVDPDDGEDAAVTHPGRSGGQGVLCRPAPPVLGWTSNEPSSSVAVGQLPHKPNPNVSVGGKPKPTPRAMRLTILVPLQTWLRVSPGKEPLLRLLEAARAANGWFQSVYPADVFDGSSDDSGPSKVVALREDLLEAICEVDHAEVPASIVVRGTRSCSADCPWYRRTESALLGPEAACTLFDVWRGLQGSLPTARCEQCAKARVIAKEKA